MPDVGLVVAAEGVVAELVLERRPEGHRVGFVLGHRRGDEGAVRVGVDRLHARDLAPKLVALRAAHPGKPADVVQVLHARAVRPALQEADGEHAAREDQMPEVVEVVEERRDRLHGRVPVDRQHLRGIARVRHAVGADPAVRPRLRHDPVDDFPVVAPFVLGELEAADAERGPAPARVDEHQRVSRPVPALGLVEVGVALGRRVDESAGPPVAGRPDHGGQARARLDPLRQPDIDRNPHAVPHGDVEGLVALKRAGRADRPRPGGGGVTAGHGECEESQCDSGGGRGWQRRGWVWIVPAFHGGGLLRLALQITKCKIIVPLCICNIVRASVVGSRRPATEPA